MPDFPSHLSDVAQTRLLYERWTPQVCNCAECRNVSPQLDRLVSPFVVELYSMGIDPRKPGETTEHGPGTRGGRVYDLEWPFVGVSETGTSGKLSVDLGEAEVYWYPRDMGGIPERAFDQTGLRWSLSIRINSVPWILPEPQPE